QQKKTSIAHLSVYSVNQISQYIAIKRHKNLIFLKGIKFILSSLYLQDMIIIDGKELLLYINLYDNPGYLYQISSTT
ncbi:hypothetical protein DERP_012604, partial [Dermatophagoides pteronyssinus]